MSSLSTAKLNKSDTIYTEFLKQEKSMEEEKVRWGMGILEDEVEDETNKALILTEVKWFMDNETEVRTLKREKRKGICQ